MNRSNKTAIGLSLILSLLLWLSTGVAAQQPRPTVAPPATPAPPVSPAPGTGGPASVDSTNCASLFGVAVNWGFENQGDVYLTLKNGSWETNQVTGGDGKYNFGALGAGVGILSVETGLDSLTPFIDNAAVRLSCDYDVQANIGLYSHNERPELPAQIQIESASDVLLAGGTMAMTIKVKNTLPDPISRVVVTDLFPEGLTIESAEASTGAVEILGDRMLTVNIGSIPSGEEESITVMLNVADNLADGVEMPNAATLFYAESVADQDKITFAVGQTENAEPTVGAPETHVEVATPVISDEAAVHIIQEGDIIYDLATQYQTTVDAIIAANADIDPRNLKLGQELLIPADPNAALEAADAAAPEEMSPPDTLPITGLGVSFSFAALLLVIAVLLGRGIRSVKRS